MYEIPKIAVPTEVHLFNQEAVTGNMFVTEDLLTAAGHPSIEDFLNASDEYFFPFQSDAGAYRLINKRHVTFIRVQQDDEEVQSQTPLPPRSLVVYFANGQTLYGLVYPTLIEESRVLDILNDEEDYMALYQNRRKLVINRHQVMYVNAK